MECSKCHKRKEVPLKRCKHFELGGDKKRKVFKTEVTGEVDRHSSSFLSLSSSLAGTDDSVLSCLDTAPLSSSYLFLMFYRLYISTVEYS